MNQILGGLRAHELTLLCAPTGSGKTALLATLSAQLIIQGVEHFVAPVETGPVDYTLRVMSALLKQELNFGEKLSRLQVDSLAVKIQQFKSMHMAKISTYEDRVDIDQMIAQLMYQHDQYGTKVALLDNLNFFLRVTSSNMEKFEMDSAIHEFVVAAKKLPMHIFLVVHPRKTDGGRVESEFDIKGSSTAVQEASNVILFNRPKQTDTDSGLRQPNHRELVFKKIRRRGSHVNKPIWFQYVEGRYTECL